MAAGGKPIRKEGGKVNRVPKSHWTGWVALAAMVWLVVAGPTPAVAAKKTPKARRGNAIELADLLRLCVIQQGLPTTAQETKRRGVFCKDGSLALSWGKGSTGEWEMSVQGSRIELEFEPGGPLPSFDVEAYFPAHGFGITIVKCEPGWPGRVYELKDLQFCANHHCVGEVAAIWLRAGQSLGNHSGSYSFTLYLDPKEVTALSCDEAQ
jgi:hypothetical protein